MIVTIDAMAKRYSKLPSEILNQASTFDMVIMDAALSFEVYQQQQAKTNTGQTDVPDVDESTLLDIWNKR